MSEDPKKFTEQMLAATFEFAKLALTTLVLLNSGAATAVLAFMGAHRSIVALIPEAASAFAFGAALGGISALFAYFGQRANWEAIREDPEAPLTAANFWFTTALVCTVLGYVLFFFGCVIATVALNRAI